MKGTLMKNTLCVDVLVAFNLGSISEIIGDVKNGTIAASFLLSSASGATLEMIGALPRNMTLHIFYRFQPRERPFFFQMGTGMLMMNMIAALWPLHHNATAVNDGTDITWLPQRLF